MAPTDTEEAVRGIDSLAVIVSVMVSPDLARVVSELSEAMAMVRVGAVRSIVTEPLSADVSVAPALPAASAWLAHENVAAPSVSSPLSVRAAVHEVPEASVAPGAPTTYIDDDGAMVDPRTGRPDAALTDRDMFLAAIDAGLGRLGAHIGSIGDQPDLFRADMLAFHASVLGT